MTKANMNEIKTSIEKARELTLDYAIAVFDAKGWKMVNAAWVVEQLQELKSLPLDYSAITASADSAQDEQNAFEAWWGGRGLPDNLKAAFFMVWKAACTSLASNLHGEPVAWQARFMETSWDYVTKESYDILLGCDDYEVRELFTAPPSQQAGKDAQDAARYRVLRDPKYQRQEDDICVTDDCFGTFFEDELDNAVDSLKARYDAAMQASPAQSNETPTTCGCCHGSGWMVRDPDIGTDQECFACDGTGQYEAQQSKGESVLDTCMSSHGPEGCYRVRCQLGKKCVSKNEGENNGSC